MNKLNNIKEDLNRLETFRFSLQVSVSRFMRLKTDLVTNLDELLTRVCDYEDSLSNKQDNEFTTIKDLLQTIIMYLQMIKSKLLNNKPMIINMRNEEDEIAHCLSVLSDQISNIVENYGTSEEVPNDIK